MFNVLTSKPAQAIGTAFGILTGIGTVLSWLTPEWFGQLSWPQAILVGTGLALAILLILSVALAVAGWGRRQWRTLPSTASDPAASDDFGERLAQLDASRPDFGHLGVLESRVDRLEKAEPAVVFYDDSKLKAQIEELGELNNKNLDYAREQIESLYNALSAVYHRERLNELGREIDATAAHLSKATEEEASYDAEAWKVWEQQEAEWRVTLTRWIELAEAYRPGTFKEVNYTPQARYKGLWTISDTQFPNSNAVYDYKTFRIRLGNWQKIRDEVEKKVHRIAFEGGTASSQPVTLGGQMLLNAALRREVE